MRIILTSFIVFIGILFSCERSQIDYNDLIGKWLVIAQCDSCTIFEFIDDQTLLFHNLIDDVTHTYEYKLYHDNTIQIKTELMDERYPIKRTGKDTLIIVGFMTSAVPEEMDTILKRLSK